MESDEQSAAERAERIVAISVTVSRLAGFAYIPLIFLSARGTDDLRDTFLAALCAAALLEGCVLVCACWRIRAVRRWWIAADLLFLAGLLAVPTAVKPPLGNIFYSYVLVTSVVIGVAPWSLWSASAASIVLAGTDFIVQEWWTSPPFPVWQEFPNAISVPTGVAIAWVLAWQLRRAAVHIDRYRGLTVANAAELAAEQERARQVGALRVHLLGSFERLTESGTLRDPRARAYLVDETAWLRRLIEQGTPEPPGSLLGALQAICDAKAAMGFVATIRLEGDLPPSVSVLPWMLVEAAVDATREALTNVAKHAGVTTAEIVLGATTGELTVEVIDRGEGFDPADTRHGIGLAQSIRQRVAEVGGDVDVTSVPGQGTSVRMTIALEEW